MVQTSPKFAAAEVAPDGSIQLLQNPTTVGIPAVIVFGPNQVYVPAPQIIPLTTAPRQTLQITLGGQACNLRIYAKSINAPIGSPDAIATTPPVYENISPVFMDIYVGNTLIAGGCICLNGVRVIRASYTTFIGDFIMIDTQGNADPQGVSARLPPLNLRNAAQRALPLNLTGMAPSDIAGTIPGLGTRFLLTYWYYLP